MCTKAFVYALLLYFIFTCRIHSFTRQERPMHELYIQHPSTHPFTSQQKWLLVGWINFLGFLRNRCVQLWWLYDKIIQKGGVCIKSTFTNLCLLALMHFWSYALSFICLLVSSPEPVESTTNSFLSWNINFFNQK